MKKMFWCELSIYEDSALTTVYNEYDCKLYKEVDRYFIDENNRWIIKKAFENLYEDVDEYGEPCPVHTVLYGFIYDTLTDKEDVVNKKKKKVKDEILKKVSPVFNKRIKTIEENFKKISLNTI